jgi:pimeloyl-ACP methyl ester carboxylesterase
MQSACWRWWGLAVMVGLALIPPAPVCAAENSRVGQYAALPGVKLWFTDTGGTGTPIVLLHANTGTSASWEPQATAFVRKAIASSPSIAVAGARAWPIRRPARNPGALLDALAEHLKLDKFHLVGVAGGGFISLDYAAWRPERLRSLVVAGSTGQFAEKETRDFTARVEIPELRKQAAVYREVGPSYRGVNPEGTKRWIEIEEHAQQPGAPSQPLRTPNTFAKLSTVTMPILSGRRRSPRAAGADARLGGPSEELRVDHGARFRPRDRLGAP